MPGRRTWIVNLHQLPVSVIALNRLPEPVDPGILDLQSDRVLYSFLTRLLVEGLNPEIESLGASLNFHLYFCMSGFRHSRKRNTDFFHRDDSLC